MRSNEGSGGGVGNCSLCCSRAKYHRCCSYVIYHPLLVTRVVGYYVCMYVRMCVYIYICVCWGGGGAVEQE